MARVILFPFEKRRLLEKILTGFANVDASKLFSIDNTPRKKSNGVKLRSKQVQLDSTKFFFTNDVVREWNKLPPSAVQCDTINSLKPNLTTVSSNMVSDKTTCKLFDLIRLTK